MKSQLARTEYALAGANCRVKSCGMARPVEQDFLFFTWHKLGQAGTCPRGIGRRGKRNTIDHILVCILVLTSSHPSIILVIRGEGVW